MKKKQAIWIILMLCWWGFLFPEFTFSEDNLRAVYSEEATEAGEDCHSQRQWDTYVDFLGAEPEQIKVKSRLLEWMKDWWNQADVNAVK